MDYKKEIQDLITLLVNEGASDLHMTQGRTPVIRVAGALIPLFKRPVMTAGDMKGFLDQFLSPANMKMLETARNVDFSYELSDTRFRGNVYYRQGMVSIALRVIPKAIKTLTELNLPPILESELRGRQLRHAADGLFKRQDMALADELG